MRQLNGQDSTFVFMEKPGAPLHLTSIYVYDPSTAPGGKITHKQLLDHIQARIHTSSVFTQKLKKVPGDLDYPYWVDDDSFDLEFHVRHIALPSPHDWRQLCILVARLHSRGLDMSRPPWEMYIIEGLDNVAEVPPGSFAILSKYHHAAIDGVSGIEIVSGLHDVSADAKPRKISIPAFEDEPSNAQMLWKAGINNLRAPFHLAKVLSTSRPKLSSLLKFKDNSDAKKPAKLEVPKTRFNDKVSPHRVFTGQAFDFDDLKQIRKAVAGATINDVVLAMCSGALRHYLADKGEIPDQSLVSMAPINTRTEQDENASGNVVSAMFIAIQTQIEDPLQRLQLIQQVTAAEKTLDKAVSARRMTDINQHIPAATLSMAGRLITSTGLAHRTKPITNCVITNVPGPQIPLYMCGAQLLETWGSGPVMDGLGLFFSAHSYNNKMFICITACRDLMSDPGFFRECLVTSVNELKAATQQPAKKAPRKTSKRKTTKRKTTKRKTTKKITSKRNAQTS